MAYWASKDALDRLAQSESSGKADLVHYPTGYTKSGTKSSASGLYGFLDSTWQAQAAAAGVDTAKYPRAYMAPADVQTAVAARTPISNWTCPGCNTTAQRIAAEPGTTSATPTFTGEEGGNYSGGGDAGGGTVNPQTGQPDDTYNPEGGALPGNPNVVPGIQGGVAAAGTAASDALPKIGTWLKDQGIRLGIMVLGIVLIGIAALALAWGEIGGAKGAAKIAAKVA